MTTMADGLDAQDSSKSAFMEFGQQQPPPPQPPPPPHSQQSSPAMAGAHYPLHCLHSAAGSHPHHQHHHHSSPYSGSAGSYNHRSLAAYPYVSHSQHSPYLQSYHNSSAASQTRADDAGEPAPLPEPAASFSPRSLHSRASSRPPAPGTCITTPAEPPAPAEAGAGPGCAGRRGEKRGGRLLPRPLRGPTAAVPAAGPPRSLRASGGCQRYRGAAHRRRPRSPRGRRQGAALGAPLLRRDRL